jgi:hypothetical protein
MRRLRVLLAGLAFFAVVCLLNRLDIDAQTRCPQGYSLAGGICVATPGTTAMQSQTVTLTAAQVNGMFAAPILILPAPATGSMVVPVLCTFNAVYGGAAFSSGGAINLFYGNVASSTSAAATQISVAFLTTLATNQIALTGGFHTATPWPPSSITSGGGLYLSNLTGAFSGGAGATLRVSCLYYVATGIQ